MKYALIALLMLVLTACGGAPSEPIEVPVTVVVEKEIEVTRIVGVTSTPPNTPAPEPTATPSPADDILISDPILTVRIVHEGNTILDIAVFADNPNPDWWIPSSEFTISVYDSDGNIVGTDNNYVVVPPNGLAPMIATYIDIADKEFSKVVVSFLPDKMKPASRYPDARAELVQSNIVGDQIVGQVINNGSVEIPQVKVVILVKNANGDYLDIDFTYASDVLAGRTVPFELYLGSDVIDEMGDYEIYLAPELVEGTL